MTEEGTTDGNTTNTTGNTTTSSNTTSSSSSSTSKSDIKIEVLNGTSNSRTLQEVVNKLKEEGYNVSRTGTTTSTSKTVIANKTGVTTSTMNDIQDILGIGTISDSSSGGTSSRVDVTVIIGKDYE